MDPKAHKKIHAPRKYDKEGLEWYVAHNVTTCCGVPGLVTPDQEWDDEFICPKCGLITDLMSEVCYRNPRDFPF